MAGYPDPGFERMLGCRFKDMASTVSWARLIAASGVTAIAYTNREPEGDLHAIFAHIRANAAALGIDDRAIGVWASSGHAPLALSLLMRGGPDAVTCAVLCYGYLLDLDGADGVAEAARTYRFTNACAGRSMDDVRRDVPLFLARAGRDETPHLNETLDRFVTAALTHNLPVTLANHPDAPHAFDLEHDSAMTRAVVKQTLTFLRLHLLTERNDGRGGGATADA